MILSFILLCVLMAFVAFVSGDFLGKILVFCCRGVVGGGVFWVCQTVGIGVGCNLFNVATFGFLGLPGFIGLVSLGIFL